MLKNIIINVYCHNCYKICSSNIKPKPVNEAVEFIKKWEQNPYCIECIQKRMRTKNNAITKNYFNIFKK